MCFVSVMLCCVVLWCCCVSVGVVFMYYDIVLVLYWTKVKSGQKQPVAQSSLMRGPWEKQENSLHENKNEILLRICTNFYFQVFQAQII